MERLSRRDFLKLSTSAALAAISPGLLKSPERASAEPLVGLPVLYTAKAPVYIEHRSLYGSPIDHTLPGYESYRPDLVEVSGIPLDILPPIAPDTTLELKSPLGIPWTADLPHITSGRPFLAKAVVGWGDGVGMRFLNGSLYGKGDNFVSSYAFSDRPTIYPSKIYNDLTALAMMARWHRENGPFLPGHTYSYLELSGVVDRVFDDYLLGQAFWAGGICATASAISKSVFLAAERGYTEIKERYLHQPAFQYAENPFDPAVTKANSDATVAFLMGRPANYRYNTDFKFSLKPECPPLYFSFGGEVFPNDNTAPLNDERRHFRTPADARLIFGVSLVTQDPNRTEDQAAKLLSVRDGYARFHDFSDLFALNEEQKR